MSSNINISETKSQFSPVNEMAKKKPKLGTKRSVTQIMDTIGFEYIRNIKKTIILTLVMLAFFLLNLGIKQYQESLGVAKPDLAADYAKDYVGIMSFLIMILGVSFGGPSLTIDFEKQTGNILFPKISRNRLFIARIIALWSMETIVISFNYLLIGITTYIKYEAVPKELWISMGWAIIYSLLVLSFVMFFSSFMKSASFTIVLSLLFLLIGFQIIQSIYMFTTKAEPYLVLTYFSNIITYCFKMPDPRYMDMEVPVGGPNNPNSGEVLNFRSWLTPSIQGAIIGMIVYTIIFLGMAFLFYRRRQAKQ